jgi:O-antigen/teichoic acid export membrane protein
MIITASLAVRVRKLQRLADFGAGRAGVLLGRGAWGIADQALLSVTNFVTMVVLARSVSPADFGLFILLYSGLLIANSLQSALITQPHNVLGATRKGQDYAHYTGATAASQVYLVTGAGLLILAAAAMAQVAGGSMAPLLLAAAPALAAWQCQEFIRRVLYTEGRVPAALLNDAISYGGQAAAILALAHLHSLTAPRALYIMAATSALAAVVGVWQVGPKLRGRLDLAVLSENWAFGKWLAGGELGYWLSHQIYMFLAAAILGVVASGALKAAQLLFGPAQVLSFALVSVLPTWLARTLASSGSGALYSQVKAIALLTTLVQSGYCLLVVLVAAPLLRLLYGGDYAAYTSVVALFAAYAVLFHLSLVASCAVRAIRRTRAFFVSNLLASLVALATGWLFVRALGLDGAVLGMILTALIANAVLWSACRRSRTPAEGAADREAGQ